MTVTERKSRNLNQRKLKNRRNAILTFFSTTTTTRLIIVVVVVVVLVVYDVVVVVVLVLVVVSYPDKNERRTHDVTLKTKSNFFKSTVSLTDRLVKRPPSLFLFFILSNKRYKNNEMLRLLKSWTSKTLLSRKFALEQPWVRILVTERVWSEHKIKSNM